MATSRKSEPSRSRRPPATTPEARENQLVSAAVDLAEKQIREGTVSAQVLTHYLKMASSRNDLEMKKLTYENALLQARTEAIASQRQSEEMYVKALAAMKAYSGQDLDAIDDY